MVINDHDRTLVSRQYFTYYEDPSGKLTIREMLGTKAFHKSDAFLPKFGLRNSVVWMKMEIRNDSKRTDMLLSIPTSIIDDIGLYEITGRYHYNVSYYASDRVLTKPLRGLLNQQKPQIRFKMAPGETKTFLLQVQGSEASVIPVYLTTRETYLQDRISEDVTFGGFLGIMGVTVLFNAVLYIILRDKSYIYYVSYTFFLCISQFILRGYGSTLFFAGYYEINNLILPIVRAITGVSIVLFVFEFLQLETQLPRANRYFYISFFLYSIPVIFALSGTAKLAYLFLSLNAFLLSAALITIGIILYKRGFKPARFFLIGWGFFLLNIVISLARNRGFLPYTPWVIDLPIYAVAIQSILFSLALADKISFYRDQKNALQVMALEIARENEQLVKSQNLLLETKVNERTRKLQETNRNLHTLLHNLRSAQTALVENEKMASLGQLTAGIAHEINNPINFVGANVRPLRMGIDEMLLLLDKYDHFERDPQNIELLAEIKGLKSTIDPEYLKSEIHTLLDGIEDGALRTSEIVKSLRIFSRTDEQELKPTDINKGILTTLVLLRQMIPDYIQVLTEFDELPIVNCYPGKLNQVYMNLLNNSLHAITAKKKHNDESIRITTVNENEEIRIEIADTGIGMEENVQKRMFEPFFTTKEVGEGTGLGMSIVFGIIEKHRGNIEVKSAPDSGTAITLRIPKNL